ncbi:hypothetical protein BH24ACI3_BH24ACI3_03750 [soil metagenome]
MRLFYPIERGKFEVGGREEPIGVRTFIFVGLNKGYLSRDRPSGKGFRNSRTVNKISVYGNHCVNGMLLAAFIAIGVNLIGRHPPILHQRSVSSY